MIKTVPYAKCLALAFFKFYLLSELLRLLKIRNYLRKFKNEKLPKFKNLSVELDHLLGFLNKNKFVLRRVAFRVRVAYLKE